MWTIFNILSVGMKILQKKSVGLAVIWKKIDAEDERAVRKFKMKVS